MAIKSAPSQDFLPLKDIRDGVVILRDGSLRAILMTSSLNFALKSQENQEALIYQFQNMLNGLDFSVQIYIQSRRLDIQPYIALLEERYRAQMNDLMKLQTREYIEFIRSFTDNTNIMTKSFFLSIPYFVPVNVKGALPFLKKDASVAAQEDAASFEQHKAQLLQRVAAVEQGLTRMGLRSVQLGTEEITELLYRTFNPTDVERHMQVAQ